VFKLEIATTGAAFDETPHLEVAEILDHVAERLRDCYSSGPLRDANGNMIGSWELTSE
jgi:hypothetical protein